MHKKKQKIVSFLPLYPIHLSFCWHYFVYVFFPVQVVFWNHLMFYDLRTLLGQRRWRRERERWKEVAKESDRRG